MEYCCDVGSIATRSLCQFFIQMLVQFFIALLKMTVRLLLCLKERSLILYLFVLIQSNLKLRCIHRCVYSFLKLISRLRVTICFIIYYVIHNLSIYSSFPAVFEMLSRQSQYRLGIFDILVLQQNCIVIGLDVELLSI